MTKAERDELRKRMDETRQTIVAWGGDTDNAIYMSGEECFDLLEACDTLEARAEAAERERDMALAAMPAAQADVTLAYASAQTRIAALEKALESTRRTLQWAMTYLGADEQDKCRAALEGKKP